MLVALIQFAIFEAALRVWGSSEAAPAFQGLFTGDPVVGYRLKPHARVRYETSEFVSQIDINGLGVRDDEEIGAKAPGERRIVVLGDSLVLSVQVAHRESFTELLEQRLNRNAAGGVRYRVINAGVQGYGPVEELLFFRKLASALQPDLVLHALFVGNDAEEALASEPRLSGSRSATEAIAEDAVTRLRRLVRRSMVLQVLRLRVVSARERFAGVSAPPEPPLQSYAANPAPRIAQGLAVVRQCVEQVAAHAESLGARTAVALVPARFQIDDADYGRLREGVRQAGGELVRDAATERFHGALAGIPLPRVDLLPALRAHVPGPGLFFQETVHLTPRGHEVVAEALDRFLRDEGLLETNAGRSPAR